jgi:hypothetical protein
MLRSDRDNVTADETWPTPAAWVPFVLFIHGVLLFAGAFIFVRILAGQAGPPLLLMAFWFAALGWNIYWWLFRVAYRVHLVGGTLHWRAPFNAGSMPVYAIESVGRFFGSRSTCVLRGSGHQSLIVFTQNRPFAPMLMALNRLNSAVPPEQH